MGKFEQTSEIFDAYEVLAGEYNRLGDSKPSNAYLERPATVSLLPDVEGSFILDAGCGAGHLAFELVDQGANVLGIDISQRMVEHSRHRVPEADVIKASLEDTLPFKSASFDGITSSLAFHYIHDWDILFKELKRVLKSNGWIVFSVQHPHADFEEYSDSSNYHDVEWVTATWTSFGREVEVPTYRRPLTEMVNPALLNGFHLDKILEPIPTEEFQRVAPERYEYEAHRPNFLCFRYFLGDD